eukprot:14580595-Alexandrium_andersonii.AAC.2
MMTSGTVQHSQDALAPRHSGLQPLLSVPVSEAAGALPVMTMSSDSSSGSSLGPEPIRRACRSSLLADLGMRNDGSIRSQT